MFRLVYAVSIQSNGQTVRDAIVGTNGCRIGCALTYQPTRRHNHISTTVHVVQATERVGTEQVRGWFREQRLTSGEPLHLCLAIRSDPKLLGFVKSAGSRICLDWLRDVRMGGPIVTLATSDRSDICCAVLCENRLGDGLPKFSEGCVHGGGWAVGTLFVAVPAPISTGRKVTRVPAGLIID